MSFSYKKVTFAAVLLALKRSFFRSFSRINEKTSLIISILIILLATNEVQLPPVKLLRVMLR